MSNKFYGVVATTFEKEESYVVKDKKGKPVEKSRTVVVPNEVTVKSSANTEVKARKELQKFAKQCGGRVVDFGTL